MADQFHITVSLLFAKFLSILLLLMLKSCHNLLQCVVNRVETFLIETGSVDTIHKLRIADAYRLKALMVREIFKKINLTKIHLPVFRTPLVSEYRYAMADNQSESLNLFEY